MTVMRRDVEGEAALRRTGRTEESSTPTSPAAGVAGGWAGGRAGRMQLILWDQSAVV